VQDRLHDRLQADPLSNQLRTARDLPPASQGCAIGNPYLGQETGGIELRQDACVDGVGLDLRLGDQVHLERRRWYATVATTTPCKSEL